jgi:hypothetical protein
VAVLTRSTVREGGKGAIGLVCVLELAVVLFVNVGSVIGLVCTLEVL